MKRKLPFYLLFGLLGATASAQSYQPLTVSSGYTADVIANGAGSAALSTTQPVDNANFAFMSNDFLPATITTPPSYGLPATGLINSLATTGLTFQMASLSSNNSLRIGATTGATSGTLAFSNGGQFTKLYVLATSGSGASTISALITFDDGTTQSATSLLVPDWFFSTAQPIAAQGFGRVNTTNNVLEPSAADPRLYQITLNIDAANQIKDVVSVQFTKTSTAEGVVNIFGVTAEVLPTCPAPSALVATTGPSNAAVSFTAAIVPPSGGYDYYYATTNTAPTTTTTPSGTIPTGTSVNFPTLITGQTYYFWVRSNCGDGDTSAWVGTTFTTGQVTSTYTAGDISTMYNDDPTVTSATSCPGTLSVTVPAGYQIASVATSYTMTSLNNGYQSEQRSMLYCTTTSQGETSLAAGSGLVGTYSYNRTGLTIANGATGTVNFELRAWRMWGDFLETGCGTQYNKVNNNSWMVTVTYTCLPPAAPVAEAQTLCGNATVADLTATGTGETPMFNWYTTATGGSPLEDSASLTTGVYYVSQTNGTCESARLPVDITLGTAPGAPVTTVTQTRCPGATVANLYVDPMVNATVVWTYNGVVVTPDAVLESGIYEVTQTLNGCTSLPSTVTVTISATAAPTVNNQSVCEGATVSNITMGVLIGATVTYYETEGGEPISSTTVLENGTYYLSQTLNGCESATVPFEITVNAIPDAPTGTYEQTFAAGETLSDLELDYATGATLTWYTQTLEGDYEVIPVDTALEEGFTYYVTQTTNGCESDYFEVTVTMDVVGTDKFTFKNLKVYPNPATDIVTVANSTAIERVTVTNLLGQQVLSQDANESVININLTDLSSGTYILNITSQGANANVKIVKQ
ncbi:T9SS type A sorting domain-containing protein [Flavobacterium zepuense]|uniref:T9SS type A sorting domain-containing protein n=1 Tax=Flavobacterium zepuense TaxID=2593302 RepID=A0A552UWS4_9FLAO|nr:T9SS type A sorting domain-containing protein [Flavobacterium zepuense]TRW22659.1 T9SS type A sorting domain-containing protein [Flavobacterium zepuense]